MLEKDFKKKVQKEFTDRSWVVIQLVAGAGIPMGFPDTLLLSPRGLHVFVEWKAKKGAKRQPLQEYWVNKLNIMGHDTMFISPENVDVLLKLKDK